MLSTVKIYNNTHEHEDLFTKVIELSSEKIGISNIDIMINDKQFNKSLLSIEDSRACVERLGLASFNVSIELFQGKRDLVTSMIHELQHIKQMLDNRMVVRRGVVWFEGKLYTAENSTYETRPFEKEAIDVSNTIYKEIKEDLK